MSSHYATGNEADGPPTVPPFRLRTRRHADFKLADALQFLVSSPGEESTTRFIERYDTAMRELCQSIAEEIAESDRYHKRVDAPASAYNSRPAYRLDLQTTTKRARRSSTGLWYVYYTIDDADGDGKPDTVTVYSIEQSASQPFAINTGQFDEPDEGTDE